MCEDRRARMIIKYGTGKATVPATSDHRDGTWLATDVYPGEWYIDTLTGQTYIRNGSNILSIGDPTVLQFKGVIKQTGSGDPIVTPLTNTFNGLGTIVWTRLGVGVYNGTLAGVFPADKTIFIVGAPETATQSVRYHRKTTSVLEILTFDGGAKDGVLKETPIIIEIYP